uniref:ATP synthase subunit a n=1 Tax=Heteronotia binoei TaxID=13085 RepID=A9XSE1_9SAUR|nr:ATP synthase F0 subunit 6 [Heteronotia binoei]ABR21257.1 ATP synthase F0 subunit 6 [Heteronotia binoei]ABR21270.1 ATP synthase F0 subunit 6 [Heteronotia binoei]ABR21283.1 ATP synthase F0 subunit 6 [Heteronotia binoei]ABR21296.1 ATP synthase F0 subunit 6 [Heteronotia binoei]
MTLDLFSQFMIPQTLGIPLILLALLLPTLLVPAQTRVIQNRTSTMQGHLMLLIIKQLLNPLNKTGHPWALLLMTTMLLLSTMNLTGLLPYTFTPTTQLSMNMALAVPLWLMTVLTGFRTQPTTALAHMLPTGTPPLLIPPLILIETVSLFIRPLALGVRLTANLTAGHLLITLISLATTTLLPLMPSISLLTLTLLLLLTLLEIAVAMIQAYVFVLLLSLYLQENT